MSMRDPVRPAEPGNIALLFPGQGSQMVGMLHELPEHPAVTQTLEEASALLHRNVLHLDSVEALQSTVSVQLALLVSSVAVARALEQEGIVPQAVAGLSVGAFGAAVHCGVLRFADAIRLVSQRSEQMAAGYPGGYGMAAIVGLTEREVHGLVVAGHANEAPVYVANINAPRQIVIAGSFEGIERVLDAARRSGATRAERLAVAVPSHCPLLEPIAVALRQTLGTLDLGQPRMLYVGNVRARVLRTPELIAEDLANNIMHGVRWHDATMVLGELGCRILFEMPPGHVLTDLAKSALPELRSLSVNRASFSHVLSVGRP